MEKNKINLNGQDIVYSLNICDVQTVAMDMLNRNLTAVEIESLKMDIAKNMAWYDAIQLAIMDKFEVN